MVNRHARTIASVQQDSQKLTIDWDNQQQSIFHYIWLRDNCRCPACGDPALGKKRIRIMDIPADIRPESITIKDNNQIEIIWGNDQHQSIYPADWLSQHCYSESARTQRHHQPILWDNQIIHHLPQVEYVSVLAKNADHRLQMLEYLRDYGICLVRNVPPRPGELESFAASLGVIVQTETGQVFDIVVKPEKDVDSVAHLNTDLIPHNDDTYRNTYPSIIFFHCIVMDEQGGGQSTFVDGLHIAEQLRKKEPKAFDLLSRYAVTFCKHQGDRNHIQARSPLIKLDNEGNIQEVRISNLFIAPFDLPETIVEPFYAAYRKLMELYTDPKYQLILGLCPGDLVILDNHRILHGRTAINSKNQDRHLRHCYGDRDYLYSQLHILTAQQRTSA